VRGGGRAEGQLLLLVAVKAGARARDARQSELAREHVLEPPFAAGGPLAGQFARYAERLIDVLGAEVQQTGSVRGCPFGNLVVELLPADLDANDLAEAILAHVEGLFVIAKARNDPAVFERLPRDVGRLLGSPA
jgi:hypothetical protein